MIESATLLIALAAIFGVNYLVVLYFGYAVTASDPIDELAK
jgi:hypothetical protein